MGWERVCGTAGCWRVTPELVRYLPVQWRQWRSCETAWVTPGPDCLCSYACGHGAVRPQTGDSIWDGVFQFVVQGRTPLVSMLWMRGCANGGEPGSGSCIPENESLFGPQNQPKLIVSMSLGHSVEFQVRRAPRGVPSPIRLDHGDVLVMDV